MPSMPTLLQTHTLTRLEWIYPCLSPTSDAKEEGEEEEDWLTDFGRKDGNWTEKQADLKLKLFHMLTFSNKTCSSIKYFINHLIPGSE